MDEQQHGDRIKLNVGGKLFETTSSTLQSGGPDSLLAILSSSPETESGSEIFIDRDPEIFSVLLSLLRSNRLPSTARKFSNQELADEALYYGVESCLRAAMAPPLLSGIDASAVRTIQPAAEAFATCFSAGSDDGSVWIAHGGQISAYDWILSHVATVRTHLNEITSLRRAWPEVAVVGSTEAPGLHFYNVIAGGYHVGSVHWSDSSDPRVYRARVASIASDPGSDSRKTSCLSSSVFAALECPHQENSILAVDKTTLQVASEIGRQGGSSMKTSVATKLSFVPERELIFASAVSAGAFGYSGYMRLWDPRSGEMVWETMEPGSGRSIRFGDSFADADVDRERSVIYKVCWKSGDVGMADLRKLGEDPWVYLEERSAGLRNAGGGEGSVVCCYRKQVFVSRESGLEVWSEVEGEKEKEKEKEKDCNCCCYRRNLMEREESAVSGGVIKRMEGGGDRLFLSRDRVEGVEVWETSDHAGAISAIDLQ